MAVDEDLFTLAPTAVVLVLFVIAFIYVLVDFQAKRSDLELRQQAIAFTQLIATNSSGVLRQADLPAPISLTSAQYSVQVNLTDLENGASWVYGSSNGSAVASVPLLLERASGYHAAAKLFVRIGRK